MMIYNKYAANNLHIYCKILMSLRKLLLVPGFNTSYINNSTLRSYEKSISPFILTFLFSPAY